MEVIPMDLIDIDEDDEGEFVSEELLDEREEEEFARFFVGQDFHANHSALPLVANFGAFLETGLFRERREEREIFIRYDDLRANVSDSFLQQLHTDPGLVYPAMEMATYRHYKQQALDAQVLTGPNDCVFVPRILDWPITALKHIKSHFIGRFISVAGTVIRASLIKERVVSMPFKCAKCGITIPRVFEDGKFVPPASCITSRCNPKKFDPQYEHAKTVSCQTIRIQENIQGVNEDGKMPRMFDIELLGQLTDVCVPGDTVTVTGIVKKEAVEKAAVQKRKNKAIFFMYLEARTVINTKKGMGGAGGRSEEDFDAVDLRIIRQISSSRDVFRNVVNSLSPSIYGHELVKAGLALALFGGTHRQAAGGSIPIRGDPHVLIVGDPGLGKSQMLRAISHVAPRSVYVCGSFSTTSGLTVTLMKEPGTGDFILEAGALVLADQGVCCIDEFDKMPKEHQSLLEAMEQQSISVAKAGIVCTLMARTSVIAAANPAGGHYDRAKTIAENLKISPALLSRFDLIFILLDKPNELIDQRLSEHVMALHGNAATASLAAAGGGGAFSPSNSSARQGGLDDGPGMIIWQSQQQHAPIRGASQVVSSQAGQTICERLKVTDAASFSPIPPKALRKYITYAKKHCHPRLSDGAADVLQKFYLRIREQHMTKDSTPITNRQLESLIRLSEARARLELRDLVTQADAEDVVELMEECMFSSWEDQFGNFDVRRSTGMSKAKLKKAFCAELNQRKERQGKSIYSRRDFESIAKEMGIFGDIDDFYGFIDEINITGSITRVAGGSGNFELRW